MSTVVAARFDVVGVTFVDGYPENLHRLAALLEEAELAAEPLPALLLRDPDNPHDLAAVAVHVPAIGLVGHLPRPSNAEIAVLLDSGEQVLAHVDAVRIHPEHTDKPGITVSAVLIPREHP